VSPETNLYYIHLPMKLRPVAHPIDFLPVQQFLEDEEVCRAAWDLVGSQFRTRSKFLTIWPHVRFVAVHRDDQGVGGLLLVSTPINWQIDYVVVPEERRGEGIATSLVSETVNQALVRQVPYVMLTSRERLRLLYEGQCRFVPVASSAGTPPMGAANGTGLPSRAFAVS
jgi:hypothetical protein